MPIAVYKDRKVRIPFDAEQIANMIYRFGVEVYPDEGTHEIRAKWEKAQVDEHLRNLWGDKNVRTKPHTTYEPERGGAMREDARFSQRIPKTGGWFHDMNVEVNPYLELPIGIVDGDTIAPHLEKLKKAPRSARLENTGQSTENREAGDNSLGLNRKVDYAELLMNALQARTNPDDPIDILTFLNTV